VVAESASGASALTAGHGALLGKQTAGSVQFSVLDRTAISQSAWYFAWGAQAQRYDFSSSGIPAGSTGLGLSRLQSIAADLRLEYFEHSSSADAAEEAAAELSLQPGWYFEHHFSMQAWDIPVEAGTGVPIPGLKSLTGAIGFENARFYHHAVPYFGVIWQPSDRFRLEALYPEPALVFEPRRGLNLRFGGELVGAGFLTDALPARTPVEYDAYRIGATVTYLDNNGLKISAVIADETEREFDFFREHRRVHGSAAPCGELSVGWQH
jgi:hypothetical protein